jgi:rubrerythrin
MDSEGSLSLLCCACQECSATIFRDCGHRFCNACAAEFADGCREDYCDKETIKLDSLTLQKCLDAIEKKIINCELEAIRDVEVLKKSSDEKLKKLIQEHNEKLESRLRVYQYDATEELYSLEKLLKKVQASQNVAEMIESMADEPLAASVVKRFNKGKFYRLSNLERCFHHHRAWWLPMRFSTTLSYHDGPIVEGSISLYLGNSDLSDDGTARHLFKFDTRFKLRPEEEITLLGQKVTRLPSELEYPPHQLWTVGSSENKDAFYLSDHTLLFVHDKRDQTLTVSFTNGGYSNKSLKDAGMYIEEAVEQVDGDLYKICSDPPIYILADCQSRSLIRTSDGRPPRDHDRYQPITCRISPKYHYFKVCTMGDDYCAKVPRY